MSDPVIVGWREWVSLPALGVSRIKAKLDTGARSSSLHVFDLEQERDGDRTVVRFGIHPRQRTAKGPVRTEAEVLEVRRVRSSSGHSALRPVIRTEVSLLGETWPIEVTLANRGAMGFRLLVGREALRGRFVVDPGRSYYGGRPARKKKKKRKKA